MQIYFLNYFITIAKKYLSVHGFAKQTELNKTVLYVYIRSIYEAESQDLLLGAVSTNESGLFDLNSLETIEPGEYIITIKGNFSEYKKLYYLNTNMTTPYIYDVGKENGTLRYKGYTSLTGSQIRYKSIDLSILNAMSYSGFLTGTGEVNNNGYFEGNIYTHSTGSVIIKVTDNMSNIYTKVINK